MGFYSPKPWPPTCLPLLLLFCLAHPPLSIPTHVPAHAAAPRQMHDRNRRLGERKRGSSANRSLFFFSTRHAVQHPLCFYFIFPLSFFCSASAPAALQSPRSRGLSRVRACPGEQGKRDRKRGGGGTQVALKKHKTAPPRTRRADLRPLSRSPPPSHLAAPFTAASYRTPTSRQLTTFHTAFK